jgi:hypothetical protein
MLRNRQSFGAFRNAVKYLTLPGNPHSSFSGLLCSSSGLPHEAGFHAFAGFPRKGKFSSAIVRKVQARSFAIRPLSVGR